MWQSPSINDAFSSESNELALAAEDTTTNRRDLANSEVAEMISPDTSAAGLLRSRFNQNRYEMSLPQSLRSCYRRRHRMRPYGMRVNNLEVSTDTLVGHTSSSREDSPVRAANKPSSHNQQETENEPNEAESELLDHANSLQNSPLQLDTSISSMDDSVDDVVTEQGPLIPLIRLENHFEKSYHALNKKPASPSQAQNILEPLLNFDFPSSGLSVPAATTRNLANNLIKLSRNLKTPDLAELCCLDCGYIPVQPVTGQCGHTRCKRCILSNGDCPCSASAPKDLFLNTVVQEIIEKMRKNFKKSRHRPTEPETSPMASNGEKNSQPGVEMRRIVKRRQHSSLRLTSLEKFSKNGFQHRMPMTLQARYRRARHLIDLGKNTEAASHLARVAASSEPISRCARVLLHQVIAAMCNMRRRQSGIPRRLRQLVRAQSARSWLKASDLECILCTDTFSSPVATPCGHTYCRECLERCMSFRKQCALCLRSLDKFNIYDTQDTVFITSILLSIDVIPWRNGTEVIPVVNCHVAYPGMPFPLFVFDPRYCRMVQLELQSGSRRFGMLAYNLAAYGTVLEIRDCILFEDGRCIVSTVGVSRFKVLERFVENGCDVARVRTLSDLTPPSVEIRHELHMLGVQVYSRSVEWLHKMNKHTKNVLQEIETAFGSLPSEVCPEDLDTPDGPAWLWWVVTVLPVNREIKFLILSTRSLLKRILAVSRALELVDSDGSSQASSDNNSEESLSSS